MKKAVLNLAIERAELILSGKVMYGGHEKQLAMALIQLWQKQPSPTEAEELKPWMVAKVRDYLCETGEFYDEYQSLSVERALNKLILGLPSPSATEGEE